MIDQIITFCWENMPLKKECLFLEFDRTLEKVVMVAIQIETALREAKLMCLNAVGTV